MRWFRDRFSRPDPVIDPERWARVRAAVPWVAALDPVRDARLAGLAARFLAGKTFSPARDLVLDDDQRAMLAALCCLPLLEFGADGLRGWWELIVYPQAFHIERRYTEVYETDGFELAEEGGYDVDGEAWERGPLILSWADIEHELRHPRDGRCLAVHEMAHKLDVLEGGFSGTPPLPREWRRAWVRDFEAAYETFAERVDAGRRTAIDASAAEAPEEFFAVCSEYHFSAPARLRQALPTVAAHLERFYGPSPFATSPVANAVTGAATDA